MSDQTKPVNKGGRPKGRKPAPPAILDMRWVYANFHKTEEELPALASGKKFPRPSTESMWWWAKANEDKFMAMVMQDARAPQKEGKDEKAAQEEAAKVSSEAAMQILDSFMSKWDGTDPMTGQKAAV